MICDINIIFYYWLQNTHIVRVTDSCCSSQRSIRRHPCWGWRWRWRTKPTLPASPPSRTSGQRKVPSISGNSMKIFHLHRRTLSLAPGRQSDRSRRWGSRWGGWWSSPGPGDQRPAWWRPCRCGSRRPWPGGRRRGGRSPGPQSRVQVRGSTGRAPWPGQGSGVLWTWGGKLWPYHH